MSLNYQPPYSLSSAILGLVSEISEWLGRHSVTSAGSMTPYLRRGNRIRSIQASLSIENNSLTLEQVTAVIDGKRVLGLPREIQEVRNAYAAYEGLDRWKPCCIQDLLEAHAVLMSGLVNRPGHFRSGGVGIYRGTEMVHMAPPAGRVETLMRDLLAWLEKTDVHPLVASCAFHYEFEFIHPFSDGNGRLGRLWQTLILTQWTPILACVPVETVIRDRQPDYYRFLAQSDNLGDATPFIEFMLRALRDSVVETVASDQLSDHVTDQVRRLLSALRNGDATAAGLMERLRLSHRPNFRGNYLDPALAAGLIERTQPDSPRSPTQRYHLSINGRAFLRSQNPESGK